VKYREERKMPEESIVNEETDFENEFNKLADGKLGIDESKLDKPDIPDEEAIIRANNSEPSDDPKDEPDDTGMYSGLNDEAKQYWQNIEDENKRLNHRINSDNGRVRAYQQKNGELKEQLDTIGREGMPTKIDIANAMKGGSESWNKFHDDYPEIAEIFDSRAEQTGQAMQQALDDALKPVNEQFQRISQKEIETEDKQSSNTVSDMYPDWQGAINTKEYAEWINQQPPGIQSLGESAEPDDAIALIGLFDMNQVANGFDSIKKATPDNGVDNPAEITQQSTEAEKLKEKRKRQLADGSTVKSKAAKIDPTSDDTNSFDHAFDFFANKKERQRA